MSNELTHYGVLGMKWGVRKDGMPQGYQGPGNKRGSFSKSGLSDKTKQRIKTGIKVAAGITATALVAKYGLTTLKTLNSPGNWNVFKDAAFTIRVLGLEKINAGSKIAKALTRNARQYGPDLMRGAKNTAKTTVRKVKRAGEVVKDTAEELNGVRKVTNYTLKEAFKPHAAGQGLTQAQLEKMLKLFPY